MAKRNGTTIDIDLFGVKSGFPDNCDRLGSECFVKLNSAEILNTEVCLVEYLSHGGDRTQTHVSGVNCR